MTTRLKLSGNMTEICTHPEKEQWHRLIGAYEETICGKCGQVIKREFVATVDPDEAEQEKEE